MFKKLLLFSVLVISSSLLNGQRLSPAKTKMIQQLDAKAPQYGKMAHKIWDLAELGFREEQSVKILASALNEAGFKVEHGVADMPTAFVAEYGSGKPVIALLAEYDALPGMAQEAVPVQKAPDGGGSGHACGHHLFGTGSVAAAIAVKDWLQESETSGTIRLYGTPAEEGGGGKVYMVRAGLFDDVDAVLTWHPGDANSSDPKSTLAAISATFTFSGKASHAAGAPERGRSALDGVEAMNHMVNLMREHIPMQSRIHYSIQYGGGAPNVVPAKASVSYVIRHPDMPTVRDLLRRVMLAAEGAAMGTETSMEMEIETGYFNIMPNQVLAKLVHDNLQKVGGVEYDATEKAFALEIMKSFNSSDLQPESAAEIRPYNPDPPVTSASTDVGDISWVVPTSSMRVATWVPGSAAHSWQAVASGGTSIGPKGMMVAAKSLGLSAMDLFMNPSIIKEAKTELEEKRGADFEYKALLGDREPPLDYRADY